MADGDVKLSQTEMNAIYLRLEKFDTNIGKIFDLLNEVRITMAKNTHVLEEHHSRSTKLERIQALLQRRQRAAEKALQSMTDTLIKVQEGIDALELNLEPIKTEVDSTKKVKIFLGGFGPIAKWLSLICGAIIAVYGAVAIIRDYLAGH